MRGLITAALLSVCALPAFADVSDNPSGFYLGAGAGRFNLDIRNLEDVANATGSVVHSDNDAWKIFAGYRFIPYFALEAAYIDFGRASDRFTTSGSSGNYRLGLSGFAPYAIGTLPLGPVELFGKIGYYYYNVNINADFSPPSQSNVDSSHSRTDLLYGAGIGMTFFDHLHVRAEYETVDIKNAQNSDAFWLSGAWRF